jgi:hypothetical protein
LYVGFAHPRQLDQRRHAVHDEICQYSLLLLIFNHTAGNLPEAEDDIYEPEPLLCDETDSDESDETDSDESDDEAEEEDPAVSMLATQMRNMESRYSLRSATMIDPQSSWMAQRFHA